MKSESTGCFVYAVIIFFGIISIIYISMRRNNCQTSQEYPCSSSDSNLSCAECNDGSIVDLSTYWNQFFITPCTKNGGVKQYKCKKCL
jgi:hypothetical protein